MAAKRAAGEEAEELTNYSRSSAVVPYSPAPTMNLQSALEHVQTASLKDMIVRSALLDPNPQKQTENIVRAFNARVKDSVIVLANAARTGERLDPGFFLVAHKNKIPEIRAGTGERLTLALTGAYTEAGHLGPNNGIFRQNEPLIGDFGTYLINVPQGKIARVWSGNVPRFLGEGPHVIHDPNFRAEPPGSFLANVTDACISHGNLRIVLVPIGTLAKVRVDTRALLLPYRREPYTFDTAQFLDEGRVKESEPYIEHGPLHLVRVPAGSVALGWLGSKALLLEYRDEPYFFDDPLFRIEKTGGATFVQANVKHIKHGTINRVWPGVNADLELAVLQHDGRLEFVSRFSTIDSAQHAVLGFLNMGLQTFVFPSRETKDERRRDNPKATAEEISYEPMTTRDSLKVGLKLLVAYQVKDPQTLLQRLRLADIVGHVENLAVSDMARAVQNSTSQNFLNSNYRRRDDGSEERQESIADRVRGELSHHLSDCGLELVRFNVEEAKVLDAELAKELAKQSLVAATASAQQAVIEQKAAVARSNAELEAMARKVKQDQDNLMLVSAAQAELQAARLRAEGLVVEAEAKQKALELEGLALRRFPELLHIRLAEIQSRALAGSRVTVVAPELAQIPLMSFLSGGDAAGSNAGSGNALFARPLQSYGPPQTQPPQATS